MAIKQRPDSNTIFSFSYKVVPSQYKWGDNPHMDQLGATSHILPAIVYDDQKALDWIRQHTAGIKFVSRNKLNFDEMQFINEEDAVLFKITWL